MIFYFKCSTNGIGANAPVSSVKILMVMNIIKKQGNTRALALKPFVAK
jgi:hypothetical protein